MPCGGISDGWGKASAGACFVCHGKRWDEACTLFCEEWDAYLHYRCLAEFLTMDEGRIMLDHGHGFSFGEQPQKKAAEPLEDVEF
jgi:hypothetical protein